ncbi:esterase-like activity of phytase family protein [Dyadobacter pollutisoli]|uniref:Esterase-like activity of phytase family protein n=1 Tax=Dyadobacter pollutisoli TaxID=2910158 RepID=A0A9E8N9I0_9BACT|nr:esterase-like activity of phytase family protein [Dyadobacter pollutisoli]WAC12445.1 esterase-like activity of phytase family protein [Dyadobacter pollutisoli]
MKNILAVVLLVMLTPYCGACQNKFEIRSDTILKSITSKFHGLSAIEYIPRTEEWILANDRGHYFKFRNCNNVRDFNRGNLSEDIRTDYYFESVRYDSIRDAYFFSVETDTYTGVYSSIGQLHAPNPRVIIKLPLPSKNKGVEGIALSPSGALWIAAEAGWESGTDIANEIVYFYRYKNPLVDNDQEQPERFKYKIRRYDADAVDKSDRPGGISEILAVDENCLLVLERCYIKQPGGNPNRVFAQIRSVTVNSKTHELEPNDTLNFDFSSVPVVCNVEGMAWGDLQKQTLFVIADDGLGDDYFSDEVDPKTGRASVPTLRNQMIVLKRK